MYQTFRTPFLLLSAIAIALGGCAGIPADRGLSDITKLVAGRGGPEIAAPLADAEARKQTGQWLTAPLTVESAQRVALSRNPRLVEQYARLGVAQAQVYEAARLSNPRFSLAWLNSSVEGEQVTLGLAQNFADLLLLSPRKRIATGELARAQQIVAADLLALASEVEVAYYRHIGALAVSDLRNVVAEASAASAELAQRFRDAGNMTQLDLNRERAAATSARIEADKADAEVLATRIELNTLMGLTTDEDQWKIETRMPLPVTEEDRIENLQRLAQDGRLDLLAVRKTVVLLEDALGVTRSYRLLGVLDVGVKHEREPDGTSLTGPTLTLELPLFNWGRGRIERAKAALEQARADARRLEIEVGNSVQLAYARVSNTRGLVERYRTELIPQREEVLQRSIELQNYMLIGQFELLVAKQDEYNAYLGYLDALTAYWIARAELALAVGALLPSSAQIGKESVVPEDLLTPKESGTGHGGHHGMSELDHSGHDMDSMEGMDHSAPSPAQPEEKPTSQITPATTPGNNASPPPHSEHSP